MTDERASGAPRIAAHRGGMGEGVASSLAAFRRAALELGVDLELDIHPTADGELVVFHDDRLDPSTHASGPIREYSLEQLLRDVDLSCGATPGGVRITTLREVFAASGTAKLSIDLKEDLGPESWVESALGALVNDFGLTDRVVVASFLDPPLQRFRTLYPGISTAATSAESVRWYQAFQQRNHIERDYAVLSLPLTLLGSEYLSRELVDWAHEERLEVWVWTVNEVTDLTRVRELGVDVVVTDFPRRALELYRG